MTIQQQKSVPHRNQHEIKRNILEHLNTLGPSGITEILYSAEINHLKAKEYLHDLAAHGLIVRKKRQEFVNVVSGRHSNDEIRKNRLLRTNHIKTYIAITPQGRKYLKRIKELEALLGWKSS
jgi:predicted transcriptional regulator